MEGMIGEVFIFDTDGGTEASGTARHRGDAILEDMQLAHDDTESRLTDTDHIDWIPLQNLTETTTESVYIDDLIIG